MLPVVMCIQYILSSLETIFTIIIQTTTNRKIEKRGTTIIVFFIILSCYVKSSLTMTRVNYSLTSFRLSKFILFPNRIHDLAPRIKCLPQTITNSINPNNNISHRHHHRYTHSTVLPSSCLFIHNHNCRNYSNHVVNSLRNHKIKQKKLMYQTTFMSHTSSFNSNSSSNNNNNNNLLETIQNRLLYNNHSTSSTVNQQPTYTVHQALLTSINIFNDYSTIRTSSSSSLDLEDDESSKMERIFIVCHLLSHTLSNIFQWEDNGFSKLFNLVNGSTSASSSSSSLSNQQISKEQLIHLSQLLYRAIQNEPVQYILGKWDFYNLVGLKVAKPCLCPRPETEELVDYVLKDIKNGISRIVQRTKILQQLQSQQQQPPFNNKMLMSQLHIGKNPTIRILDVGCGTGAIGLAIAKELNNLLSPGNEIDFEIVAIDISMDAIHLSRENSKLVFGTNHHSNYHCDDGNNLHGTSNNTTNYNPISNDEMNENNRYQVICCSAKDFTNHPSSIKTVTTTTNTASATTLQDPLPVVRNNYKFQFDIVVSNPPYIPTQDMNTLSPNVLQYEDYNALCGGDDGMNVIRDIIDRLPEWCEGSYFESVLGLNPICWMEVDTSHHADFMEQWFLERNKKMKKKNQLEKESSTENENDKDDGKDNGLSEVQFVQGLKDMSGLDRFIQLRVVRKT